MKKIIIIGAGPTGLSTGYRLIKLGYDNFIVYEQNSYVGGLCASPKDNKNFTWDLGGHVIFSHYRYYNSLLQNILGDDYLEHRRKAWIYTKDRWIPYPFQNNIRYLPKNIFVECLQGLKKSKQQNKKSVNFEEWVMNNLGEGITKHFMLPLNYKLWAYPPNILGTDWISEKVSKVGLKEVTVHSKLDNNSTNWGPNAVFKYPLSGGIGEVFRKMAFPLNHKIELNSEIVRINPKHKKVILSNGKEDTYDVLINTSPLDKFIKLIDRCDKSLLNASLDLKHNGMLVVGIGINKRCPSNKCWIYFPDNNCPFFRATYLSNYSTNNVPDSKIYYSILCENTYSEYKKESKSKIIEKTIQGLINSKMINEVDRKFIVSRFLFDVDYAYPIPTLKRDEVLRKIQPELEKMDIYSRGRFGAWKYEIGDTDHSIMQGKEIVDRILRKEKEKVWRL